MTFLFAFQASKSLTEEFNEVLNAFANGIPAQPQAGAVVSLAQRYADEIVDVDLDELKERPFISFRVDWSVKFVDFGPIDVHPDIFHRLFVDDDVMSHLVVDDVARRFGCGAEERRAFAPAHLEGVRDNELYRVVRACSW